MTDKQKTNSLADIHNKAAREFWEVADRKGIRLLLVSPKHERVMVENINRAFEAGKKEKEKEHTLCASELTAMSDEMFILGKKSGREKPARKNSAEGINR